MKNIFYDYKKGNKVEKIGFLEEESENRFIRKIYVFNLDCDIPLHPYILKIENAKLLKKKDGKITVCFPSRNKELVNFMKSLDKTINKDILNSKKGSESIEIINNIPMMTIATNSHTKAFTSKGEKMELRNIALKSNIKLVIEMETVYIKNNKKDAKYWKLVQIQKHELFDANRSLFNIQPQMPQMPQMHQMNQMRIPPLPNPNPNTSFGPPIPSVIKAPIRQSPKPSLKSEKPSRSGPPTISELLKAKSLLKKGCKRKGNKKIKKINEGITNNPVSGLKKVKTREPMSGIEMMKTEHELKEHIKAMCTVEYKKDMEEYPKFLKKQRKKYEKFKKLFNFGTTGR